MVTMATGDRSGSTGMPDSVKLLKISLTVGVPLLLGGGATTVPNMRSGVGLLLMV